MVSVHDMVRRLEIEAQEPLPRVEWLEQSWREPRPFWAGLLAHHSERGRVPLKSRAFQHYDLYHDAVVRHLEGPERRDAFRWYDDEAGWQALPYDQLHAMASRLAAEWVAAGVKPGQKVALVLSEGPELLLTLVTAWKLGCVPSILPATGARWTRRRLEALAPERIATDDLTAELFPAQRAIILRTTPTAQRGAAHQGSFVYPTGSPAALLFSRLARPLDAPVPVSADAVFLGALRDATLSFGLKPGAAMAAPGFDVLQFQPALLLASLLAGGTFVHLSLEQVRAKPTRLLELELASCGIARSVREVLLDAPAPARKWGHWWRAVEEDGEMPRWHSLCTGLDLASVPTSNLLVDSTAGGCRLFSARRRFVKGGMTAFVLPVAGAPWSLGRTGAFEHSLDPTLGAFAGCCPGQEETAASAFLVKQIGHEWMFVGPSEARRAGGLLATDEIIASLKDDIDEDCDLAIVPVPTTDLARPFLFGLLVFLDPGRPVTAARREEWKKAIADIVTQQVGAEHVPDRVDVYPFRARRVGGSVDQTWCTREYLSGGLERRARDEGWRRLAELRAIVERVEPVASDKTSST
jgi:hypothetical protein